ncbi:5,6-dimethylbenzimidazole synthase [Thalassovita mediterranea]|jgi:5,6-dimethylbenzimidazole synthase|uniref:F420-0--gamma-glutamyl ligase n=1 Tax=Thalassovita mediterranea TaxID=340021 RepID=A0A0P1H3T2_9RHOB|nr:5,6-dimethylbenzimidazole synthase [Thalassovita mediterranea]CUH83572.1 F420-0--gamma-glutamyl ligase [Thalassovita mediterranea]SIS34423.1 cob(II)yrinic acid a,c-diamide reductase [Thalassovita mediterranea]
MHTFPESFQRDLDDLLRWRRDVRHFRSDPVDEALLQQCLDAFLVAPSVGLSEPWRIIRVESDAARAAALANYQTANAEALTGYSDDKAALYAQLKLSGMQEAPVQLAVYCDESTEKGAGLGAGTMPEMRRYSVVSAINLFWLAARARGIGVGWVSVLDPDQLNRDLDVPAGWLLVGYLCVGYPEDVNDTPELERKGWEDRRNALPIERR